MPAHGKGTTHIGVDPEDPLDFDQIIQELLLHQIAFEDDARSESSCFELTPVTTPSFQALQDLRKVRPLADLTQHAQTALLGGTLYEYHTGNTHRDSHTHSLTARGNPEEASPLPAPRPGSGPVTETESLHSYNSDGEAPELEDNASIATLGSAEDLDSASEVLEMALTGHGVLSTEDDSELHLGDMEDLSLDESISRSIQRVLQLGAVVVGQQLSDQEIQALPKARFSQGEQRCPICLEMYEQGELLNRLRCGHFFHINCLARWMRRAAQCPLCRESCADEHA